MPIQPTIDNAALVQHAINEIASTYGDTVSVQSKKKSLNKFGRRTGLTTTESTIMGLQGSEIHETLVTTNLIDSIVSSSTSDTSQTIVVEGHTIDASGNLTFVTQEAALNGRTEVTLTTPLARCTRAYIKAGSFASPAATNVGVISVYDNTAGITAGVPNTAAATKLRIEIGRNQSDKGATSISSTDYWVLTGANLTGGKAGGSATFITARIQIKDTKGGVWRPLGSEIACQVDGGTTIEPFQPYRIVPKNHDVRLVAYTDTNTATASGEIQGFLASVL